MIDTLIICYNNPEALENTLKNLFSEKKRVDEKYTTIYDNGSNYVASVQIAKLSILYNINY